MTPLANNYFSKNWKIIYSLTFLISISIASDAQVTHQVTVQNFSFTPANLVINQGDVVEWVNIAGFHNVNGTIASYPSNSSNFGNGPASAPWTYSFTFNDAGTNNYRCDIHPMMQGTITVMAFVECTVDGGTIATTNSTSVCVGTGSPKTINVTLTGAVGPNGIWALTQTNGDIVATRPNNALFNLDIYPAGTYRIGHMRYDNTVNLVGITNPSQLSGCFDISNLLTVNLSPEPNGGTISTTSPTTVCVGNGLADVVSVTRTGFVGASSGYGVLNVGTNTIVAAQTSPNFNFDGFAPGTYRIYSIAYQAGATVVGVTTPSSLAGCYDLSNFIQVTANSCTPAKLTSSPNPTTGQSFVTFSVANEEYTTVEVYDISGRQITSLFNQVVESGVEYRLEFDGQNLPNGIYIYRLTTGSEVLIEKFMIAK